MPCSSCSAGPMESDCCHLYFFLLITNLCLWIPEAGTLDAPYQTDTHIHGQVCLLTCCSPSDVISIFTSRPWWSKSCMKRCTTMDTDSRDKSGRWMPTKNNKWTLVSVSHSGGQLFWNIWRMLTKKQDGMELQMGAFPKHSLELRLRSVWSFWAYSPHVGAGFH